MPAQALGEREPRAVAYTAAAQFAFGAAECLVYTFAVYPAHTPVHDAFLAGAVFCLAGALLLATFAARVPWRFTLVTAWLGVASSLAICDRVWNQDTTGLVTVQMLLIVLTVAIFSSPRAVVAHALFTVVGWAWVCSRHGSAVVTAGAWLAVGPAVLISAVLAQWLVRRLLQLIERDALTGIANRATWDQLVAADRSTPGCIALLDLDRFKEVNDGRGHAAGDQLLRDVSEAWAAAIRPGDVLARVGGDEFAVFLRGVDLALAEGVVERLRARTTALTSVSIGLAERGPAEPLDITIRRADAALYRAKREGRDRVATS